MAKPVKKPAVTNIPTTSTKTVQGPLAPDGSLSGRTSARPGLHLMREFNEETKELILMLSYRRPKGGVQEKAFIDTFLKPLGAEPDAYGNLHVVVGDNEHGIVFSSHTDSVHRDDKRQFIHVWSEEADGDLFAGVPHTSDANCLGADDAAGMWLMVHMIRARVPGHYVFHYGEEAGGIGSTALNKAGLPLNMDGSRACIAFDRRGYSDVITHQGWGRTASDAFAVSLAAILYGSSGGVINLTPSANGVYTDSAEYAVNVAECTNVSVGYHNEHSRSELLNLSYLFDLRDALIEADWSKLVIEREPDDGGYESFSERYERLYGYGVTPTKSANRGSADPSLIPYQVLVSKYPTLASEMLALCQISKFDFIQEVVAKYGALDEDFDEEYSPIYPDVHDEDDRWGDAF